MKKSKYTEQLMYLAETYNGGILGRHRRYPVEFDAITFLSKDFLTGYILEVDIFTPSCIFPSSCVVYNHIKDSYIFEVSNLLASYK